MADERPPFPAFHFGVEINGIEYAFKSCGGLKVEQAVVELEEGGFNATTRKLPGRVKYPPIVLKQGFCGADSELYRLRRKFMNDLPSANSGSSSGKGWVGADRFSGTITQLGPGDRKAKWIFLNGMISKWEGPELDVSKNEVSIESVEITHEGLWMITGEAANPQQPPPQQPKQQRTLGLQFASGSSAVSSPNPELDSLASDLKNDPTKNVRVEGHTDNVGSASSNQTLSQKRADAVRDYLIQQGVPPGQVTAVGYGQDKPIADNSTDSGRSQNRRVEVNDV